MSDSSGCVDVNGWSVWFEKFGSGPHTILLIPGPIGQFLKKVNISKALSWLFATGTGRTDYEDFLDGDDEFDFNKYTIIAVEAPGWGRSRPPLRKYDENVYNNDCECFHAVMKVCLNVLSIISLEINFNFFF